MGKQRIERAAVAVARPWRALLAGTTFVGITGSAGKTTTKDLLVGVLSRRSRGVGSFASMNDLPAVAGAILRSRPTHGFCVLEMSESAPGALKSPLALVRPTIGIVTVIGNDHWSAFRSRDAIAQEVRKLIESLPATGTAGLNADDPLVASMAERVRALALSPPRVQLLTPGGFMKNRGSERQRRNSVSPHRALDNTLRERLGFG